jgi:hypothetical protein
VMSDEDLLRIVSMSHVVHRETFKIGDYVMCKKEHDGEYCITKHGVLCEVTDVDDDMIEVRICNDIYEGDRYDVEAEYFEHVATEYFEDKSDNMPF